MGIASGKYWETSSERRLVQRRDFLKCGLVCASGAATLRTLVFNATPPICDVFGPQPPAASLIPVVGDGKWVWTEPPENDKGYLEPRSYEVSIGIQLEGGKPTRQIKATTPVPVELPEQKIDDVRVEADGCQAQLRQLAPEAGQLCLFAAMLARGQVIRATARFKLTLRKQYHGYEREQFPIDQEFAKAVRRQYLADSPGIQTRDAAVRKLATEIAGQIEHPWDKAEAFHGWVWKNIEPRVQYYTNVVTALRDRVGDCEERAAVFVAFCRASGIPARLVWVPNHNWAEFYLRDHNGQGHWIPSHTSAYSWFGWTGAHEMVLQKGDRIKVPEKSRPQRLLADWMQFIGGRPKVRYDAHIEPLAASKSEDPGPGTRTKDGKGEWVVTGQHELDRSLRDGS